MTAYYLEDEGLRRVGFEGDGRAGGGAAVGVGGAPIGGGVAHAHVTGRRLVLERLLAKVEVHLGVLCGTRKKNKTTSSPSSLSSSSSSSPPPPPPL